MIEQFINGSAFSTLNGGINNSVTSLVVTSATGFPTSGNFRIKIDDEILAVTAVSGTTFTVTRGQEGTTADSHANGVDVNFELTDGALDAFRADSRQSGTLVDLPSTQCKEGMIYLPTDAPYLFRHNGSDWESWGPFWQLNPPKAADFTGINLGTSTIIETNGFMRITCQAGTPFLVRGYFKSAPSTPYRVYAMFGLDNPGFDEWMVGPAVRESSSGKIMLWGPDWFSGGGKIVGNWRKMTDANTFSNNYFTNVGACFDPEKISSKRIWWGLYDDGTNWNVQYSLDRFNWVTWSNFAHHDFLTADQVGFVIGVVNATNTPRVSVLDWNTG